MAQSTEIQAFRTEVAKVQDLYAQTGLSLPQEATGTSLLVTVGSAYIPAEVQVHPDSFSPTSQQYIKAVVRPTLSTLGSRPASRDLFKALGNQTGRALMAGIRAELINPHHPMDILNGRIAVDGEVVEFDRDDAEIVEFGMGMNGFAALADSIRDHNTRVTAIQKTQTENYVLEGMAAFNGGGEITLLGGGIKRHLKSLHRRNADLLVASRVHAAGEELRAGLAMASKIVRPGGLVIARGPTAYSKGFDYDKAAAVLHRDQNLETIVNVTFNAPANQEPNRSVVARRVQ